MRLSMEGGVMWWIFQADKGYWPRALIMAACPSPYNRSSFLFTSIFDGFLPTIAPHHLRHHSIITGTINTPSLLSPSPVFIPTTTVTITI